MALLTSPRAQVRAGLFLQQDQEMPWGLFAVRVTPAPGKVILFRKLVVFFLLRAAGLPFRTKGGLNSFLQILYLEQFAFHN